MTESTEQVGDALVIFGITGDLARVPGAVNIPLGELRARLGELPRDREIHVVCRSGQRAYSATRILLQNGFTVGNRSGGMLSRAILTRPGASRATD